MTRLVWCLNRVNELNMINNIVDPSEEKTKAF